MASDRGPRGRIVRALGVNIFGNPKYDKLLSRKPHVPGKPPKKKAFRVSEYGEQLREKRKYRAAYGLGERQFRALYERARGSREPTDRALLTLLESRLSNAVFRLGWSVSRPQARQLVSHGHVTVNGRRLDVPSAIVKPGDILTLRAPTALSREAAERSAALPSWLAREGNGLTARITGIPVPEEASVPGRIGLVVEFYAR